MASGGFSPGGIAGKSARHPWITILMWVVVAAVLITIGGATTQKDYEDDFTTDIESQVGANLIDEHFSEEETASETVIFESSEFTVDDPEFRSAVDGFVNEVTAWDGDSGSIASIGNYYDAPDAPEAQAMVANDGHVLMMPISLTGEDGDYEDSYSGYLDLVQGSQGDIEVYSFGSLSANEINEIINDDMSKEISIGLPIAAVVLLFVFGALLAAGVSLVLGVVTIITASGIASIIGGFTVMDESGTMLVTMIGLALGIDYSLFLLERYREERRKGALKTDAIERAGATAGKAVLFSGGTVLLALLGLLLLPITIFQGMGLATASTVVVAVLASMSLVPALVQLSGDWINFPRMGLIRRLRRQDETRTSYFETPRLGAGMWGRMASAVMRKPVVSTLIAGGILVALSLPVLTMELGQQSMASYPDSTFKTGYMKIAEYYDAGMEDPVEIVVTGDPESPELAQGIETLTGLVQEDSRFGSVSSEVSPDGELTVIHVVLHIDPFTVEGGEAVVDLREDVVPQAFGDVAGDVYVSGAPASTADFNTTLADRLPYVFAFVLGLSFVLLLLAFRSVVIPVISIVLNMLSVGAAYGAVVLVFQHGFLADVAGFTQVDTITNWLPVMLFCILFGLSMDYHVFLLSRVREHWDHTADNQESIVAGLQSTGKIITGAALIMVAVFMSFATGELPEMQQMGFGLGFAVLLDATLIRTVLVPAILRMAGDANWAFPRGLRWLPNINVEGNLDPVELSPQPGSSAD